MGRLIDGAVSQNDFNVLVGRLQRLEAGGAGELDDQERSGFTDDGGDDYDDSDFYPSERED